MVMLQHASAVAAALVLLLSPTAYAFTKPKFVSSRVTKTSSTTIHLFDLFNEGKKALVKKLAGEYDAASVRARLDSLINDNSVLMLSFTT